MLNFNEEIILKAKQAKSLEDLLQLAKGNNLELTDEMAKEYFDKLNTKSGELSDEELDNVAGGACYSPNGYLFIFHGSLCKYHERVLDEPDFSECSNCRYFKIAGSLKPQGEFSTPPTYCSYEGNRRT